MIIPVNSMLMAMKYLNLSKVDVFAITSELALVVAGFALIDYEEVYVAPRTIKILTVLMNLVGIMVIILVTVQLVMKTKKENHL